MDPRNVLKECIDNNASATDWNEEAKEKMSLQLAGKYHFQMIGSLGEKFLLLSPQSEETLPVLSREKARIEAASNMPVAFYFEHISPYRKNNLLKRRIAFMDSDKEIYLPFMALRLKGQKQKGGSEGHFEYTVPFAPGAQLVFLYLLYQPVQEYTMSQIASQLGISLMTAQRGLQALYGKGLVQFQTAGKTGKEKRYTRIDQTAYYQKGKYFLTNPVIREIYVKEIPKKVNYLKSGLTALSEQTMLGEPEQETIAIPTSEKKQLENFAITDKDEIADSKCIKVQVMRYNILSLSHMGYVDPISLTLSLSQQDERINQAIDELMEGKNWFQK